MFKRNRRIYLDVNAMTPVAPEVRRRKIEVLDHHPGNPSSAHRLGREAASAIGRARAEVAAAIGAAPEEELEAAGVPVTWLPVDRYGRVRPEDLAEVLDDTVEERRTKRSLQKGEPSPQVRCPPKRGMSTRDLTTSRSIHSTPTSRRLLPAAVAVQNSRIGTR